MQTVSSTRQKRMSPVSMRGRNFGPGRSIFDELGSSHCAVLPSFVKQQIGSITQHASTGIPLNAREAQSKTISLTTWLNGRCGIIQSFDSKKGLTTPIRLLILVQQIGAIKSGRYLHRRLHFGSSHTCP